MSKKTTVAIDITMCANKTCDKRTLCVRAEESGTQPNGDYQSYAEFNPEGKKRCKYYYRRSNLIGGTHESTNK